MHATSLEARRRRALPLYTPFRYPGGKTRLYPKLRRWLDELSPTMLIVEPFAGSAAVSVGAIIEGYAERALLCECDPAVEVIWRIMLSTEAAELCRRLREIDFSVNSVHRLLIDRSTDGVAVALRNILHNRLSFGGSFKPARPELLAKRVDGPLRRLWCPESLSRRIDAINQERGRFDLRVGDGVTIVKAESLPASAVLYADPPYRAMGRKFYGHWQVDPPSVFDLANRFGTRFLISYDDDPDVRQLCLAHRWYPRRIALRNCRSGQSRELLISAKPSRSLFTI
jgi:DNA adenine methylase